MSAAMRGFALIAALVLLTAASLLLLMAHERWTFAFAQFQAGRAEAAAWRAVRAGEAGLWRQIEAHAEAPIRIGVDPWTQTPWRRDDPGDSVECALRDLTGRLNVNNLLNPEGQVQPAWRQALERLFSQAGAAPRLVDALLDWQDADDERTDGQGSEQAAYRQAGLAAPVGNRALADPSLLRLVLGVSPALAERLAPWVTALPETTAINVNAAPEGVLASLDPGLAGGRLSALLAARPFADDSALAAWLAAQGLPLPAGMLQVSGHYFAIDCQYESPEARLATSLWLGVQPDRAPESLGRRVRAWPR